jgi:hypothetical protein
MKKRKIMVIVIAIALAIACTHQPVKNKKSQKQLPAKEASVPYVPSAFNDVSLFPGNVFEFLINHL